MAKHLPRRSTVTRNTPFERLPAWLSRRDVCAYLGVSIASADATIRRSPHRKFGKHIRIAKQLVAPDAKLCRELILQLLRDPTFQHRALLLKEVRAFVKAHGR